MKILARVIFFFFTFSAFFFLYDLYELTSSQAELEQCNAILLLVGFLLTAAGLCYKQAFPLSKEEAALVALRNGELLLLEDLMNKMDYGLNESQQLFCSDDIKKTVNRIKIERKNYLSGKSKEMISIEEFENKIKESVKGLDKYFDFICSLDDLVMRCENITTKEREHYQKKISTGKKRCTEIMKSAQQYADFRVI